eukprot:gene29093-38154_t
MTNTVDIVESPFNSLVMVQQAGSKGRGLFAKTFIPKGTLIGFYMGELLSLREYQMRYPSGNSNYVFLLNSDCQQRYRVFVDANNETLSNYTRFINHDGENFNLIAETVPQLSDSSMNSNVFIRNKIDSSIASKKIEKKLLKRMSRNEIFNRYRVGFYCIRDVFEGEELMFDYGPSFKAEWK